MSLPSQVNMNDIKSITIAAVGDICLGMGVREKVETHGAGFVFRKVFEELKRSDLRIGNLEVVFPGSEETIKKGHGDIWAPDNAFPCITQAGFDILTLGNNHIMDFGAAGLGNTIKLLDGADILHTGADMNACKASKPVVVDLGFMTVGVLSYADDEGQTAGPARPGAAEAVEKNVLRDIGTLKERVDTVILSLHMDLEFAHYPDPYKASLARKAVSAGANIVLCHHPHVLQGIEVYDGSLICYSLGNFVFQVHDSEYLGDYLPYTAWSAIIKIELSDKGYLFHTIVPVIIEEDYRPSIAEGADGEMIIEHIERISMPLCDNRCLERLYRSTCRRYARQYYWWLRNMLRLKDFRSIIQRSLIMITRPPQRRWIAGYIRYSLSRLIGPFSKDRTDDCPETCHAYKRKDARED